MKFEIMIFWTQNKNYRFGRLSYFLLLFLSIQGYAQIGEVKSENRTIIGSAGEPNLVLPVLEYLEVTGKAPYYTLWYWDESQSTRVIKSLEFYATDLELDYLYDVFKSGFQVHKQRLEVGECRLITSRPLRQGNPLKVTIFYGDDSTGVFYLKEIALERLLGKYRSPSLSKFTAQVINN